MYGKKVIECKKLKSKLEKDQKQYKEGDKHLIEDQNKLNECLRKEHQARDKVVEDQNAVARDKREVAKYTNKVQSDKEKLEQDKKELTEIQEEIKEDEEKKEEADEENDGMKRMAATIRDARDPFSSGGKPVKDKNIYGLPYTFGNRNWEFGYGFDLNLHVGKIHFGHLSYFTGLDSKGGSEIRHKGNNYVWSAVDTAVLESQLTIMGFPIEIAVPTGGGAYQATGSGGGEEEEGEGEGGIGNVLTPLDMPPWLGYIGDPKAYGSAGYPYGRWLSWEGATAEMDENVVEGNPYRGLQPYRDMAKPEGYPSILRKMQPAFVDPYFIVGVIRNFDDINSFGPKFSGNLDLVDGDPGIDRMGAIAKSELYFKRPTDLKYFLRHDKKTERPNVFSPFWQARLAKTSDLDRFMAMALQQKKIWLSKKDAKKVPGAMTLKNDIEWFLKFVDKAEKKMGELLNFF